MASNLESQILLYHALANRVIEILVLGKRVQRKLPIHLVQPTEQRSHKLHPSDTPKQAGCALITGWILGLESNKVVGRQDFNVL